MSYNGPTKIAGYIVLGILGIALLTVIFKGLWNILIPDLFNGPMLTFWQALGLMALGKLLFGFGNFGKGGHWQGHHHHEKMISKKHEWKAKLEEKMSCMSEAEKEKFKNSMKGWCYGNTACENEPKVNEAAASKTQES